MDGPARRVDVLDAGRDAVPLRERWGRLPGAARLGLAALATASVGIAGAVVWQDRAERRQVERERAAAEAVARVEARLLTARARGPGGTREVRLLATSTGPLPVSVVGGELALAGVGPLDVAVEPAALDPDAAAVVRVRAAPAGCPGGAPDAADSLVLHVRTADGEVRDVPLALGPAVWSQLARSVGCAG